MKKPIIELHNLVKYYGNNCVVDGINLNIYENEFVTLLGPSGCGKTTTLRMIGGFEYPNSGEIIVNGKIINDLPKVMQEYKIEKLQDIIGRTK